MFTKEKTVGKGAHIRPFEVKKKASSPSGVGSCMTMG